MNPEEKIPKDPVAFIQRLIESGVPELAQEKIKIWGLKLKIEDGRLVDVSNSTEAWLRKFVTKNAEMLQLKEKIRILSKIDDEVLIVGPTGTGKELLARALHNEREGKFLAVNCAGIPENLIESILFGHVKGAFTGAIKDKNGLMRVATKGTLFLDEIGELKLELQAKLLRALQEHVITKVGGDDEEEIDCRIVCATNQDLQSMSIRKEFRVDLYARISTFELKTIPLIERFEDIIPILESLPSGKEFIAAAHTLSPNLDLSLGVRSLQQYVRRFKVLGELPK